MIINYKGHDYNIEHPSQCPHCHKGIEPVIIYQHTENNINYSLWKCTYRDCLNQFIVVHRVINQEKVKFIGFLDGSPIGPNWPDTIQNLQSKFIETYQQSLKAEYSGLDEIAGMGFRKAIEYLVKDYLIQKNEVLKGKIEEKLLANVIKENFNELQEADLKDLLHRATWLGNDMTHYLKYHENFDINDLKTLIQLVVDEIHSIEQKRFYITNIQSKYSK